MEDITIVMHYYDYWFDMFELMWNASGRSEVTPFWVDDDIWDLFNYISGIPYDTV